MPFLLLRSVGSHNYRIVCCNLLLVRAKTIPKLPLHRLHIPPWKCVWLLAVRSEAPCSWTPPVRRKLPRKLRRRLGGGSTFEVKINLITKCERERLSTPLHGGVTVHWMDSMGEESGGDALVPNIGVKSYARDKLDNANIISTDIKSNSKPISQVLSWSRAYSGNIQRYV